MSLADKIRKAREQEVPIGGFLFTIRRPTDVDMIEFSRTRRPVELLRFIVGWSGVKELDLIPGGDGHPAPFDADACAEWLPDRADLFVPLVNAITESYKAHKAAMEAAEKN